MLLGGCRVPAPELRWLRPHRRREHGYTRYMRASLCLLALAFCAWIVCVAAFVMRGIDARGGLEPRAALRWGLGVVLSLVAWGVLRARAHDA